MKRLLLYPLFLLPLFAFAHAGNVQTSTISSGRPMVFIENIGQFGNPAIDYKLETGCVTVYVENGALHYQWQRALDTSPVAVTGDNEAPQVEVYRMDVKLLGADMKAAVAAEDIRDYYERYVSLGKDTKARSCNKIKYTNVYPGIDWMLYVKNDRLEYDFIVHENGNPADIKLQYDGAVSLALANGMLQAHTPFGSITEQKPHSYIAESGKNIRSSFRLTDNVLSFDVRKQKGTLVIDPVIKWATYYGDAGVDWLSAITTDAKGNVYAAGYSRSTTNVTTSGTHQTILDGAQDGLLVKFNAAGQRVWATYYGGPGANDLLQSVVCDGAGNVYVGGQTNSSSGIHTSGAYDTSFGGFNDVVLAKFDTSGRLIWGTYYGGTSSDIGGYLACDKNAYIYLCGSTLSTTDIASGPGVHKSNYSGTGNNGFIARFDSAGVRQWGTYYGKSITYIYSVSCDPAGDLYIGGTTTSDSGIATPGAHDTIVSGLEGFVAKFNSAGVRQWGTYFGGLSADEVRGLTAALPGSIYICGHTRSDSLIATKGSFKDTIATTLNTDGFIAKLRTDSGKVAWSTYYGGFFNDMMYGIAVNKKDKVFVTGNTASPIDFITPGSHQDTMSGGGTDAFLLMFDTSGYRYYASYYGGPFGEIGWGITTSADGSIYFAGNTQSNTKIATVGSYKDTLTGMQADGFIAKFAEDEITISRRFPDSALCPGSIVDVNFTTSVNFNAGNIFTVEMSDSAGSFLTPVVIGTLASTTDGTVTCRLPYNAPAGTKYSIRIKSSSPAYISTDKLKEIAIIQGPNKPYIRDIAPLCEGGDINFYADSSYAGATFVWTGPGSFSSTYRSFVFGGVDELDEGTYIVKASMNGCEAEDSIDVVIYRKAEVLQPSSNSPVCDGGTLNLFASNGNIPGVSYTWSGPNGFIDTSKNPVRNGVGLAAAGTYTVEASLGGCGSDTTSVSITEIPSVTASSNTPLDSGETLVLTAAGSDPDLTYSWTGPDSFASDFQNPVIDDIRPKASGAYIVTASKNGCSGSDTTIVVVNTIAQSLFRILPNPCFGDLTIKGSVFADQVIFVSIIDAFGRVVYKDDIQTVGLTYSKSLHLDALPGGVYWIKLKIDNKIESGEFVMMRK